MQAFEVLSAFESAFPSRLLSTLGTNAWPYIKNRLAMATVDSAVRLDTGNARRIFSWLGIKTIASSVAGLVFFLARRRGRPAFFGASTGITHIGGNSFKDYYFPYYDLSAKTCQYFVNCGNIDHLIKNSRYVNDQHIVVDNYLFAPMRKAIGLLMARWPNGNPPPFEAMASFLAQHRIPFTASELRKAYAEFKAGALLYSFLFRLLRPSAVYVVSAYSKGDLVAAARRCGIRTIEIQHGILGQFHPGYNYSDSDVEPGMPNQVDVYNEFWKDELIAGNYYREDQIRIVGRLKYEELPQADPAFSKTIVFTGQAAYRDELISCFQEWNSILRHRGYTLLYVPHPKETPAERAGMRDHLNSLDAVDLYDGRYTAEYLIKSAAAHLSLFSACHFDAVHLVGRTFVLDGAWSQFMRPYMERHPQRFIRVGDIGDLVDQLDNKKPDQMRS